MKRQIWLRRGATVAVVALGALSLGSVVSIAGDVLRVSASSATPPPRPSSPAADQTWTTPRPLIRSQDPALKVKLGEELNASLGGLGFTVRTLDVSSRRPLGGGLSLAEVRIEGAADMASVAAIAEWVAVNRESFRLKSASIGLDGEDKGVASLVLLVVVA